VPERDWSDGLARGEGMQTVDRNTPNLVNVRYHRWFGWDGASDSLWSQSIRPILNEKELASTPQHVADLVRKDTELACHYTRTFGRPPAAVTTDEALLVDIGKALAAFQETIVAARTAFDEFRDALARGDRAVAARYSIPAQRGLKIFIGKGNCSTCHTGPRFTNGEFHATGVSFFAGKGRVDPGRYEGIKQLKESHFNLLGPYNDDPARTTAVATQHVDLAQRNFGEFKVPSLRNAALTGPYMHNGQIGTLREVVRYYSDLNVDRLHADGEQLLKPLKLTAQETDDLIVFVESLTDFRTNWKRSKGGEPTCK
jgi:cytochrome c peroxidase